MKNTKSNVKPECKEAPCDWHVSGKSFGCGDGRGSCKTVMFLEAEESEFHDSRLIEATRAIKEVLAKIPKDRKGRKLSFIHTNMGTLLAWVEHGEEPSEGAVTADNDDAKVADALKLKL